MSSQSQLPVHPPPPILPVHPFQIWKTMTIFNQSVSSKHRLEPESKKRNVNDVLDWLSIYSTTHNTFVLKCFLQFAYSNLDGSQKVGGNFLNLLQEGGYPERGGGVLILEETMLATFVLWILQSLLKSSFFIEHLQKQSLADVIQNMCS